MAEQPTNNRMIKLHKILLYGLLPVLLLTTPDISLADTARDQYFKAENAYKKMTASPSKRKYRHHWLRVIKEFQKVYDKDPKGAWAAAGLYRVGATYIELYRRSGREEDRNTGLKRLHQVRQEFPPPAAPTGPKLRNTLKLFPK